MKNGIVRREFYASVRAHVAKLDDLRLTVEGIARRLGFSRPFIYTQLVEMNRHKLTCDVCEATGEGAGVRYLKNDTAAPALCLRCRSAFLDYHLTDSSSAQLHDFVHAFHEDRERILVEYPSDGKLKKRA